VFLLAEKTGWSIDYILWEIPLAILFQANHVWLWINNVNVRRLKSHGNTDKKEVAKILGIDV